MISLAIPLGARESSLGFGPGHKTALSVFLLSVPLCIQHPLFQDVVGPRRGNRGATQKKFGTGSQ